MNNLKLKDISQAMKKLDICMMVTHNSGMGLESRPMSNNKDVEFNGDSWFFANEDASVIRHLKKNPQVCLSYEGDEDLYITVMGEGYTSQDKAELKAHWVSDLDQWFEDGVDTEGLTLIHVKAERVKYWKNAEEGEIALN